MTEEEIPFIRAILASPRDLSARLIYADWLEERGDPRGEYIRLYVARNDPANAGKPSEEREKRLLELHRDMTQPHWMSFIIVWETRDEVDRRESRVNGREWELHPGLGPGPCVICGRAKSLQGYVSRMPCESCGRVLCWQCADTGIYGSLPDFQHFVRGAFRRENARLGSDSCPFCQEMDWMKAHGG